MKYRSIGDDDIFISYSRADAATYAVGLANALTDKGFSCFTDRLGTDANKDLPSTLVHKIKTCKMLVVVGTKGARASKFVGREISSFAEARGTSRVIPIAFDANFSDANWYPLVEGIAIESEDLRALETGDPSSSVVSRIEKSFNYTRSKERLRRYTYVAGITLTVLILAIIAATVFAANQIKVAASEKMEADRQTQVADEATRTAAENTKLAGDAGARQKLAEANQKIAENNFKTAEQQQKQAEGKARQAEQTALVASRNAAVQQQLASSLEKATRSQVALRQPKLLAQSVRDATESVVRAASVGKHSLESDMALRDSLSLLPLFHGREEYRNDSKDVALSPDGKHLATLLANGSFEVFEAGKKNFKRVNCEADKNTGSPFEEKPCESSAIAISNDLLYAATTSGTKVRLWHLQNGEFEDITVGGGDITIRSMALSPDGKYLAVTLWNSETEGGNGSASLWDVRNKKPISSLTHNRVMRTNSIAFGPDGHVLALGGGTFTQQARTIGLALIWDLVYDEQGDLIDNQFDKPLEIKQDEEIVSIAAGLDSSLFAAASEETATVWKLGDGHDYEPIARMPLKDRIKALAFSAEAKQLSIVREIPVPSTQKSDRPGTDNSLELWDARGYHEESQVFRAAEITAAAFRPDGTGVTTLLDSTDIDRIGIVRARDGVETNSDLGPKLKGEHIVFTSPDVRYLVTSGDGVDVWNVLGPSKIRIPDQPDWKSVELATLSHDAKYIALIVSIKSSGYLGFVYRLNGAAYSEMLALPFERLPRSISLSSENPRLMILNADHTVNIWDVDEKKNITPPQMMSLSSVDAIGLSPKGDHLVVVCKESGQEESEEETLLVWNSIDEKKPSTLKHKRHINGFLFSPSERYLLTASDDDTAQLFNLATRTANTIEGDAPAAIVSFSPDEQYFGVGDQEGVSRIFDIRERNAIARLKDKGRVCAISFSPDGKYVATASEHHNPFDIAPEEAHSIRLWLVRPEDLVAEAKLRLKRLPSNK